MADEKWLAFVSFSPSKREVLMAKVANGRRGDDTKTVGNGGVEMDELNQNIEEAGVQERNPSIDKITLKILMPPSSVRLEDNIFITEKGIRDSKNVGRNDQNQIVDAGIEKVVQGGVDKSAE